MRFDLVTIFPDFFRGPLEHGILRRAQDAGLVEVRVHDLREFTHDRHRTVDDRPFGGGEGMVLKPEPLFAAVEHLLGPAAAAIGPPSSVGADLRLPRAESRGVRPSSPEGAQESSPGRKPRDEEMREAPTSLPEADAEPAVVGRAQRHSSAAPSNTAIVLLSASGRLFRQVDARRFAQLDRIILLCGRYEGVDERVAEHLATDELSIGDFVLSGGELPAALVVDAVTRLLPGALGNEDSSLNESFSQTKESRLPELADPNHQVAIGWDLNTPLMSLLHMAATETNYVPGLLDCPHYTRPADFRGWGIPEELVSGNHAQIRRWRRKASIAKTLRNRPELLARPGAVGEGDKELMQELAEEQDRSGEPR